MTNRHSDVRRKGGVEEAIFYTIAHRIEL